MKMYIHKLIEDGTDEYKELRKQGVRYGISKDPEPYAFVARYSCVAQTKKDAQRLAKVLSEIDSLSNEVKAITQATRDRMLLGTA